MEDEKKKNTQAEKEDIYIYNFQSRGGGDAVKKVLKKKAGSKPADL